MSLFQRVSRVALAGIAVMVLACCSGQKGPAGKLVGDIEATVIAASGEAAQYIPAQLADVQTQLLAIKAAYDKQDYAQVMMSGPAVLSAASGLATAAAAKKDEILKALNDQWTDLAAALPGDVKAIQDRIELLRKKSSKKLAAGIDLDAANTGLGEATSLWSKAQAAFAAGNLDEAVRTAKDVQAKIVAVAASLKLQLAPPASVAAAA